MQPVLDTDAAAVLFDRKRGSPRDQPGPNMSISLRYMPKPRVLQLARPLRGLKKLHVQLFGNSIHLVRNGFRQGYLGWMLSEMPQLAEVAISFDGVWEHCNNEGMRIWIRDLRRLPLNRFFAQGETWRCLRILQLRFLWLTGRELSDFFERHAATLEQIILEDIVLSGPGRMDESLVPLLPFVLDELEPPYPWAKAGEENPSISARLKNPTLAAEDEEVRMPLPEWDRVIGACWLLPNLKGIRLLNVREHSVGRKAFLHSATLEDRAMEGRTNCLCE